MNLVNLAIKSLVIVWGWFSSWVLAHSSSQQCSVAGFLARRICYYGSSVCFWASCSDFFLSLCVLYVPFSQFSPFLTVHLLIRISMLSILLLACFFFWFSTLSLSISFSFSLCLFSPVWPGPGHPHPQCMYYYLSFFFILHQTNLLPLLAVLHHSSCMWMLTRRWFSFALWWDFAVLHSDYHTALKVLVCYPPLSLLVGLIQIYVLPCHLFVVLSSHQFLLCFSYNRNRIWDVFPN